MALPLRPERGRGEVLCAEGVAEVPGFLDEGVGGHISRIVTLSSISN